MPPLPAVLIVEDDGPTRLLLSAVCQRNHLRPVSTRDGREAFDLLGQEDYAAILLDLRLPRLTGLDLLRWMSDRSPHLLPRVVVITAAAETAYRDCKPLDAVRSVMRKPFELEQLEKQLLACCACPRAEAG